MRKQFKKVTVLFLLSLLVIMPISSAKATDLTDVRDYINSMRWSSGGIGIFWEIFTKVFDINWQIKSVFYDFIWVVSTWYMTYFDATNNLVSWPIFTDGTDVGIWTEILSEKLTIVWGLSITLDPNSDDDVWDRLYNDNRYLNEWTTSVTNTEIVDWTITNLDIADYTILTTNISTGAITTTNILDWTITSTDIANNTIIGDDIVNNTITEVEISDTFIARDSYLLWGLAATDFQKRVTWTCAVWSSIREITFDGTVLCEDDTDTFRTINTTNYITKSDGTDLVNSNLYDDGTNVWIWITSPTEKLHIVWNVQADAFLYNSDRRLKHDIVKIDSPLEKISKLNWYTYTLNRTWKRDIWVIAQEVEEVFPELVKTDSKTGMKAVQYGNLVSPIIEAIKELAQKIQELFELFLDQAERIDSLEKRLELLEAKAI